MLTDHEAKWLKPLVDHKGGRPANVYNRPRAKDILAELARKGYVTLGVARTGLFPDPEAWWVTITQSGREALAANAN